MQFYAHNGAEEGGGVGVQPLKLWIEKGTAP